MLKHTISGSGGLGRQQQQHISGDPRGNTTTSSLFHNDHHTSPAIPRTLPPGPYNNRPLPPAINHSFPGTVHHNRSFNNGNPYSNTSTLSTSKHSNGGTSISISPLGGLSNGGLHLSRLPPPPTSTNYAEALTPRLGVTTSPYANQLNASTLSTSKHSLGGGSSSVSPLGPPRIANGGFNLSSPGGSGGRPPSRRGPPPANSIIMSPSSSYIDGRPPTTTPVSLAAGSGRHESNGVREMLTSLGLLCLVSLLLALLSLVFMLKISPVTAADVKDFLRSDQVTVISPDEYVLVYEVTLALCALSLSLNLCCLLVCAVQFLFAVKLVRDSPDGERTNEYLKKSAFTRVCAVGGFFVSIPVFLTGIILYTFIQFHSTPAVITSALIGLGIIFCGCAMVHNVFVWQKEKTNAVRTLAQQQRLALQDQSLVDHQSRSLSHQTFIHHSSMNNGSVSPGPIHIPRTSLDNSTTPTPPEICTLV